MLAPSLLLVFFSFLNSIEPVSYYNYENRDFAQFVTICNFIFYKCGRSSEPQKSENENLYAFFQISPTIFLEAKCPMYSSTHSR